MGSIFSLANRRRELLRAKEETLAKTVTILEAKARRAGIWSSDPPEASAQSASPSLMQFTIMAPRQSCCEFLWVKKVGSPEREVAVVQPVAPGRSPVLSVVLPEGEYVAMAYSSKHGLWRGSPFKIGYDRIEL